MNSSIYQDQKKGISSESSSKWFDEIIASIRVDQLRYESKTLSKQKKELFDSLIENNPDKILTNFTTQIHRGVTTQVLSQFLFQLYQKQKHHPIEIAFDLSGQEILVWAVVKDNDEDAEAAMYIAEAIVNAQFEQQNYSISVTVIEDSDNIAIPSQYRKLNIN